MENKEAKEEEEEEEEQEEVQDIRLTALSSSFSNNRYIFYNILRVVNSIIITSTTLWYSHYFLLRSDDEKSHSYFVSKAKSKAKEKRNYLFVSKERDLISKITTGSLIFCVATNVILRIKKRSLTKLLSNIKSSHIVKKKEKKIYLKQSDLQLLNKWKCLLGGNKYYLGSLDTSILWMLYISLSSETTLFGAYQANSAQKYIQQMEANTNDTSYDWKDRYFQFSNERQDIEWSQHMKETTDKTQDVIVLDTKQMGWCMMQGLIIWGFTPSFILSYSWFPVSILCGLHTFKCGLSMEHRYECNNWIWINKYLCFISLFRYTFQAIINKLHFARYFAIREVSISTYKKIIFGGASKKKKKKNNQDIVAKQADPNNNNNKNKKKKKKMDEKTKLERRLRNLLSLRTFSYDICDIFPWICIYLSVSCTASSTYYIKTFASTSFYSSISKKKHEKNKFLLKIVAVSTLMLSVCVGIGNESYFESIKYAKRWFLNIDEYSIESYESKKKAKEILEEDKQNELSSKLEIINESEETETPGGIKNDGDDIKDEEIIDLKRNISNQSVNTTEDEESDQIEGGEGIKSQYINSKTPKYNALYNKLLNGNYQQESEMLLSARYFQQKAHDIFEYMTEICVFLEDKFINSCMIPVY